MSRATASLFFVLFGAACGGPAFHGADIGAGVVEAGEASAQDAGTDGGDVLEDAGSDVRVARSDAAADAAPDVVEALRDAAGADVVDDLVVDAPSCPAGGCRCESQGPICPSDLPILCNGGLECCNWQPPGC
jgi:hypothetical protein